jgi:hypothetical protein
MNLPVRHLHKDVWGGALMIAIGAGVAWQAAQYRVGSLRAMGPGYCPLALGVILAASGLVIAAKGYRASPPVAARPRPPEWKAWVLISLGIVGFVFLAEYFGLVAAAFGVVFISALGDHGNTWKSAALLAVAITLVAVAVFWWGLQVQLPLFRWPFT